MILHFIWLIPAMIFILSFLYEPRRLVNAYLLTLTLLLLSGVLLSFFIVGIEHLSKDTALFVAVGILLLIPLSIFLTTAYLLFNGKQMIDFEGKRLANLLSLLYGLGIILTFLLRFLPSGFEWISQFSALFLLYGSFLYFSYILYGTFLNLVPVRRKPDYIIVLGSGLIGDRVPPLLAQRLEKGKALYEKFHQEPKLIVSGGQGDDELCSEAEAMQAYLLTAGVAQDDILLENQSTTTFENLTFSKSLVTYSLKSNMPYILVVTNSFHALRAGIYMRRVGLNGRSIGSKTAFYYLPSAWLRETAGLIVLYWKWHLGILLFLALPWIFKLIHSIRHLF